MAKQLAIIKYTFMFKPGIETWTRAVEFEQDLGKFFATQGMAVEMIETYGGSGERVLFVTASDPALNPQAEANQKKQGNK